MSELTADVICRTIFSTSLASKRPARCSSTFTEFERSVASVNLGQLIFGKPWADVTPAATVLAACERIRGHIGDLLDPRLAPDAPQIDDIVAAVIAARDPRHRRGLQREELIDQMGVFFLAGHETTASVLTWVFFILLGAPGQCVQRMRDEIRQGRWRRPGRVCTCQAAQLTRAMCFARRCDCTHRSPSSRA